MSDRGRARSALRTSQRHRQQEPTCNTPASSCSPSPRKGALLEQPVQPGDSVPPPALCKALPPPQGAAGHGHLSTARQRSEAAEEPSTGRARVRPEITRRSLLSGTKTGGEADCSGAAHRRAVGAQAPRLLWHPSRATTAPTAPQESHSAKQSGAGLRRGPGQQSRCSAGCRLAAGGSAGAWGDPEGHAAGEEN